MPRSPTTGYDAKNCPYVFGKKAVPITYFQSLTRREIGEDVKHRVGKRGMAYIELTNRRGLYVLTDDEQIALLSEYQVSCAEINQAGAINRRCTDIEVLALLRGEPRYAAALRHFCRQYPALFDDFDEAIREELKRDQ
jgi:hypothetical protein